MYFFNWCNLFTCDSFLSHGHLCNIQCINVYIHMCVYKYFFLRASDAFLIYFSFLCASSKISCKQQIYILLCCCNLFQLQEERDELYSKFVKAIHEVQQKSNFKNLLLEKKLGALADTLEKKEAQLNEVLSASNLDPTALTVVTRKLEVRWTVPEAPLYRHVDYTVKTYNGVMWTVL